MGNESRSLVNKEVPKINKVVNEVHFTTIPHVHKHFFSPLHHSLLHLPRATQNQTTVSTTTNPPTHSKNHLSLHSWTSFNSFSCFLLSRQAFVFVHILLPLHSPLVLFQLHDSYWTENQQNVRKVDRKRNGSLRVPSKPWGHPRKKDAPGIKRKSHLPRPRYNENQLLGLEKWTSPTCHHRAKLSTASSGRVWHEMEPWEERERKRSDCDGANCSKNRVSNWINDHSQTSHCLLLSSQTLRRAPFLFKVHERVLLPPFTRNSR